MDRIANSPFNDDRPQKECAFSNMRKNNEVNIKTALGLYSLQHCGHEATGIGNFDGRRFHTNRRSSCISEIYGAQSAKCQLYMTF